MAKRKAKAFYKLKEADRCVLINLSLTMGLAIPAEFAGSDEAVNRWLRGWDTFELLEVAQDQGTDLKIEHWEDAE